jgi:hypothetical protein
MRGETDLRVVRDDLLLVCSTSAQGLLPHNILLVLDRVVFTSVDLSTLRLAVAFSALILLLCSLIMESGE